MKAFLITALLFASVVRQPLAAQSVSNFSLLIDLAPGGMATVGLSITGTGPNAYLLRAVGPSLATLGLTSVVAQPVMSIFNSSGQKLTLLESIAPPPINWSPIFNAVGAFPLTDGESSYALINFAPGNYSVQLTDYSGKGGQLLFETYELSGPLTVSAMTPAYLPPGTEIFN